LNGNGPDLANIGIPNQPPPSPAEAAGPDPRSARSVPGRRRPSGTPPPLPRELGASGKLWIALILGLLSFLVFLFIFPIGPSFARAESAFLKWVAGMRSDPLTRVMLFVNGLGSEWTNRIIRWGMFFALIAFRRWRHLLVFLVTVLFVAWLTTRLSQFIPRTRALGVTIIGTWDGFAFPSRPVATLAVTLAGITYTLVVPGRIRRVAKWAMWILIAALSAARFYLALDHPTDVLFGVILGAGISLLAYRVLTPNAVFPVTYGGGRAAHLDVGGRRGEAIRQGIKEQLGLQVLEVKPIGLVGSGGSTPLRLRVADNPDKHVFAKLYAKTHLRADRWYKLGRTVLYGTLEDEKPYNSVRRLVQYEDYVLRVMHDAGLPCARSYGFVEITPEREYILVTEFLEGGVEISEAVVDDGVIDDALATVRLMWDAGMAHRDVKPANILVREGKVVLIDPAFGEIRPSPWRQAVDLANMMIVLAFRADPERVYSRALRLFSPEEIAEAFAATRSVTMPTQSRSQLRRQRKEGRDIIARFRELAPPRRSIAIQRWSLQRVGLALIALVGSVVALLLLIDNLRTGAL
jgi:tRNA A-37 threonylcarbamoyl transferase component Bud32/membrane-associated phospholipid phosphatase